MRLNSFDYFRAVAILFVVAGHSFDPWTIDTYFEKVAANLISGGSILFCFISGFFFHHVFYKNFKYRTFLIKKFRNVLVPFAILSLLGFFYFVVYLNAPPFPEVFGSLPAEGWIGNLSMYFQYLWTGRIIVAYWYIPFIMLVFMLSPVFLIQIKLPIKQQLAWFVFFLIIATIVHRPVANINPIHSLIYYFPVYMLGIICSQHQQQVVDMLRGKTLIIAAGVIALSLLQVYKGDGYNSPYKAEIFSYEGIDLMILQKILMCFFFLSILQKLDKIEIPSMKYIAVTSFAVYFIHPWVLHFMQKYAVLDHINFLPGVVVAAITVPIVIIISLIIAAIIKQLLRHNSRFIIGW